MSIASVTALLNAAVLANTTATTAFTAPYWRRQRIPSGETWVASMVEIAGVDRRDANVAYVVAQFTFLILHHLSDPTDSNTYRTTDMQADQAYLMDPMTYLVAGVRRVIDVPELEPVTRIENILEYAVSVQLSVLP